MAGLSSGSREEITGQARELVDYFVADYKPVASFILAMLVVAELKRGRIALTEEAEVREMIRSLVDGKGDNGLTTEGMNRLNAYANGGYEFLAKHSEQKPQPTEEFLRVYADLIDEAVPAGPFAE